MILTAVVEYKFQHSGHCSFGTNIVAFVIVKVADSVVFHTSIIGLWIKISHR